jgi:Fic family protein
LNPENFESSSAGRCVKTPAGYWAFIPHPLPPAISYDTSLIRLLSEADRLLGELSGTGRLLANPYLLIAPYVRREAVSSSRIDGTFDQVKRLSLFLTNVFHYCICANMSRPLRIEYPGAYYHVEGKLRRRIKKIREKASSTSIQKTPDPLPFCP